MSKNKINKINKIMVLIVCSLVLVVSHPLTVGATTVTKTVKDILIQGTMTFDFVPTTLEVSGARNLKVGQYQNQAIESYRNTYKKAVKIHPVEYQMNTQGKVIDINGDSYALNRNIKGFKA